MILRTGWRALAVMALVIGGARAGDAQTETPTDGKDAPAVANPPAQPQPRPGADWQKMTPEQRRQAMQQVVEQTLRGSMGWLGYADKDTQDAVVACMAEEESAYEPARVAHRKVTQALLDNALTDAQVATLMTELRVAASDARQQRESAIATLDGKIGFSKKPRLEAFLSMVGLIGDESNFIGGVVGSIGGALGNLAAGWANQAAQPGPAAAPATGPPATPMAPAEKADGH